DKAVAFHCSNLPADMLCNPVMDHHFSENFERGCAFGTIFGRVASGPFTYARITTNDEVGEVSYYTGEGEFTDDPLETFGGYAVMDIPGLQELLQEICIMGYEHHFAATKGNVSHILEEAFEYLDINQV
ncbi:MAG TPA: fucose isomerase, partial [Candidatus Lokiarchaeia archaeon]|nr:fucose isomerase [Candidatus Lokiarchaeia archaeon]